MMPQAGLIREMFRPRRLVRGVAGTVVWAALTMTAGSSATAAPMVFQDSGATPADIQGTVDSFRAALGNLNPNVAGSAGAGRREINWDGVPDMFASPNAFPEDFFNVNSPRGVVFSTPGSGFEVSANEASGVGVRFDNLEAGSSTNFATFSPQRLFTPVDSIVTDVSFFVAGSSTPASVSGFGAVFTGVEAEDATRIEFYDLANMLIDSVDAPVGGAGALSFAGLFADPGMQIGRVRIFSGQVPIGSSDGDRVAMDDFIYGEPIEESVPEPATLLLFGVASVVVGRRVRRR